MKKIGVLLAGCGVYDGSEIHEAVLTLLAIDRLGAEAVCLAPDAAQAHVMDHRRGEEAAGEVRNILTESARIARGKIQDIREVSAAALDALIIPGGYGAAKNLCNFAFQGAGCQVHPEVARLVKELHRARKPLGAVCIAPVLLAKILGAAEIPVRVTIGNDAGTAARIREMGAIHVDCPVQEFVVDQQQLVVSTPAYMLAGRISEVAGGIENAVRAVLSLTGQS